MIDFTSFARHLDRTPLKAWARSVQDQFNQHFDAGHGDLPRWMNAVQAIPPLPLEQHELLHRLHWTALAAMPNANS